MAAIHSASVDSSTGSIQALWPEQDDGGWNRHQQQVHRIPYSGPKDRVCQDLFVEPEAHVSLAPPGTVR